MIGQSQSGTGKTAAFALTMLSRVDMDLKAPQVRSFPSAFPTFLTDPSQFLSGDLYCSFTRTGDSNPRSREEDGGVHSSGMFLCW